MRYLLGIDVGTTGAKAILFSEDGALIKSACKAYPSFEPAPDMREQDANDLWNAVCHISKEVCAGHKDEVAAISVSTQGGTLIPTDPRFDPVRRAVLWSDGRCEKEKRDFAALYGESYMYETTGWKLSPRFLPMEIRHLKDSEGTDAAYWLSVPSFISAKLTGTPFTDLSSAGIEQTADITRGEYDEKILAFANVSERELAVLAPSGKVAANLTAEAADALGLSRGVLFVSGAHDQYAALLGCGAVSPGDVMLGTGTAWAAAALCESFDKASGVPHSVAASGGFGRLSSVPSGGVCLEWIKNKILPANVSYADADAACAEREAALSGLFFSPDKKAFWGVSLSRDAFDLARAVMEGVAFASKKRLARVSPEKPSSLFFTGGASKSAFWAQTTADILDAELLIPGVSDIACLGAAVLAGVGAGVFRTAREGVSRLSGAPSRVSPDKKRAEKYAAAYEKYLKTDEKL